MIVEPYKLRPVPPELCVLTEGGGLLTEQGKVILARSKPKGAQAWANLETVNGLLRDGKGKALCWRGQPIKYSPERDPNGYHVRVLSLPFPDHPDDQMHGFALWRDWLAREGASPLGSLGSTSMSLLRATLPYPLHTSVPFSQCPPVRFTIGGRQELGPLGAPAVYRGDIRHFDLRAAYAALLGGLEYGGHWFRIHRDKLAEHVELADRGGRMVFVRARVRLAGSTPGPLVRRPRSEPTGMLGYFPAYPTEGVIQGLWTYPELRAASEQGARVRLLDGWFHVNGSTEPYPFRAWWGRIEAGRRMHGFAGLLAKATGNALWGQFCISPQGRRQVLFYDRRGRRQMYDLPVSGSRRPAHDLSEYLTGTVRAELYRFVCAAGDRLCSAHTDGGWVDCGPRSEGRGWSYPAWRQKERTPHLRVLDPQILAYTDSETGEERYVVAGWPAQSAGDRFESDWAERVSRAA